jgi:uncharacterized membrane protein
MLLALVAWVGGIMFFAFVVAPTLFTVLPNSHLAGEVVGPSLTRLHSIGLSAGAVFLICSLIYNRLRYARLKPVSGAHGCVILMLAFTAISQFVITPRMRALRMEPLAQAAVSEDEFARLHRWSTQLEGGVLFLGLGVVILSARRFGN